MRSRTELVRELVQNPLMDPSAFAELAAYGWDSEEELVTVTNDDVLAVLGKFEAGELDADDVEEWANRVEGRDDLAYDGKVGEAIYLLANPLLNESIDKPLCGRIKNMLPSNGKGAHDL